jgi:hypothetical protein
MRKPENEKESIFDYKQAVFDYWWGFSLNDGNSPKPSPEMQKAMEALYTHKKSESPNRSFEDMCNLLPAGVVSRARELGETFDKYTSAMKPEDRLNFIVGHIDGDSDDGEPAAKKRRCR